MRKLKKFVVLATVGDMRTIGTLKRRKRFGLKKYTHVCDWWMEPDDDLKLDLQWADDGDYLIDITDPSYTMINGFDTLDEFKEWIAKEYFEWLI